MLKKVKAEVADEDLNTMKEEVKQEVNMDHKFIKGAAEAVNGCYDEISKMPRKKMYSASTKLPINEPSIFVLPEHRRRLRHLLGKLVREQNWKEASGVLSTLLGGVDRSGLMEDKRKYWAVLEILSHIENNHVPLLKIKSIYEVWMGSYPSSMKQKYLIQLDYVLLLLTERNFEEACSTIKFLVMDPTSASDPVVNMLAGLICYQLWYLGIPKEMQLKKDDMHDSLDDHVMDPIGCCNVKSEAMDYSVDNSSPYTQEQKIHNHYVSDGWLDNRQCESTCIVDNPLVQHVFSGKGFYNKESSEMNEPKASPDKDEECFLDFSTPYPYGLSTSLLPIRLPQSRVDIDYRLHLREEAKNEHYINALKYLRVALYSTTPMLAALIPLVQLLLLGDQVEEALKELKKFSQNSSALLPLRLRANLLQCFGKSNIAGLSTCYEDILKKDPTCHHSLGALISMYRNGSYNMELLLEIIASHLDATFAACDIWKEFVLCLFRLQNEKSLYEDDQMSTAQQRDRGIYKTVPSFCSSGIPSLFIKSEVRKPWILRCRWWSTRHFSKKIYLLEMQAGDWELLTVKAACAAHLYGPEFHYVENGMGKIRSYLTLKEYDAIRNGVEFLRYSRVSSVIPMNAWRTANK
ncbi:hypothetical protein H6P81_012128 [Aristolochia fimbriata]|uniref:Uncharacterized protein n=1 Tax=Aristolochia fimbriata TaxID=158543 RepID=A0AAV7EAY0_ARIFI|nr:hypothetical protein H6P81_012128 [Aristolochia fimbriata]